MNLVDILIQTLGGLGLFIFGMKMMTEGLEKTAGSRIKKVLETISSNRVIGCLTGAGVTAVIQSSSATTVMLIGFVGAGIMTFEHAVGVVLGANVGTTMTAQIIAFKLSNAALPAIAIGVPLKFFSKQHKYRYIGEIILGFGLLFYGMTVMSDGLNPIRSNPDFVGFFTKFHTDTRGGVLLCVFVGTAVTMIVQSSSATVGLTMALATQGLITFPTAMALVLGENIGTTITAELATIGSSSLSAHRTARAHTLFNVIGVCMMVLIFPFFIKIIQFVTIKLGAGDLSMVANGQYVNVGRYIANGHTMFNVINAVFFLFFLPVLTKAAIFLSPKEKKSKGRYVLPEFDTRFMDSPIGALAKVKSEVIKMAEFAMDRLHNLSKCIKVRDDDRLGERDAVEEHIDHMQLVITKYLTSMYQGGVNEFEADEISEMMRITNNLERIGDSMENASKAIERMYAQEMKLSEDALNDLEAISKEVDIFFEMVIKAMKQKTEGLFEKAEAQENLIDSMRERMRNEHMERLRQNSCSVDAGLLYISLLSNYEKMGDYCFNIAIAVSRIN
ncbi:MAG: Na/Pi cotransporter family protein [Desulfamplus sp.]|nr:Na/Pi cotransporter family protein [Desulfamplus sp.]